MKILLLSFLIFSISFSGCKDDNSEPNPPDEVTEGALDTAAESPEMWHFIVDDDMKSRDGNVTGYLANLNPESDKFIFFMEGGGACYNEMTCNSNPNTFPAFQGAVYANFLNSTPLNDFVNRDLNSNPYRDWNYIFVPYSTGDVHSGTNTNADVPNNGPSDQVMNGYGNFTEIVNHVEDYFGANGVGEAMVTGSSAGGFGTYLNFIQVAERFPNAQMTGLVDAGPVFLNEEVFDACLNERWETLFQFSFPNDFESVISGNYDYRLQGIYEYLSVKYPEANFGLMSDTRDQVIRYFYGFGTNNCDGTPNPIPADVFAAGLETVQQHLTNYDNWNVYYVDDEAHTFFGDNRYVDISVNGVAVKDWIEDLRAGTAEDVMP